VAAHPSNSTRRNTKHQGIVGNVFRNNGSCSNKGMSANRDTADDRRVCSDRTAAPEERPFIEAVTIDLRTGVGDVGQDTGGAEENIVFDHGPGIDRNIVLDLHSLAEDDIIGNVDVLSENTFLADFRSGLHVTVVPDFGAGTDCAAGIHESRLMNKIGHGKSLS